MIMNNSNWIQIFISSIALALSLACGGGGGSDVSSKAIASNGSNGGVGDNPFGKATISVEEGNIDEIIYRSKSGSSGNIRVEGDSQQAQLELPKDTYSFTAKLKGGAQLKKVAELQSNQQFKLNTITTTATLYLDKENRSFNTTEVSTLESLTSEGPSLLSQSSTTSTQKNAVLALLSIAEAISSFNSSGLGEQISAGNFINDQLLEDFKDDALKTVIQKAGIVEIKTATGTFRATTFEQITTAKNELTELLPIRSDYINGSQGENVKPIANAGDNLQVGPNQKVILSGMRSFDADGDELSFDWYQKSGTTVLLDSNGSSNPGRHSQISFTSPHSEEVLVFGLRVSDGSAIHEDEVHIHIDFNLINNPPQAIAQSITVEAGTEVTLDGSASIDSDGDPISFLWEQTLGNEVILLYPASSQPKFTAPAHTESLGFRLVVNDGKTSDSKDITVSVQASPNNNAKPILKSSPSKFILKGKLYSYQLDITDPDNDPLNINLTSKPEGMVFDPNNKEVTWQADTPGAHDIKISISDQHYTVEQAWKLDVLDADLGTPVQLNKNFESNEVLDLAGTEVDISGANITEGTHLVIKAKSFEADTFEIDGSFEIEVK